MARYVGYAVVTGLAASLRFWRLAGSGPHRLVPSLRDSGSGAELSPDLSPGLNSVVPAGLELSLFSFRGYALGQIMSAVYVAGLTASPTLVPCTCCRVVSNGSNVQCVCRARVRHTRCHPCGGYALERLLAALLFALERDSGLRRRQLAIATARGFEKSGDGRERQALRFSGEADAGEVHVGGAVDDAEPFAGSNPNDDAEFGPFGRVHGRGR